MRNFQWSDVLDIMRGNLLGLYALECVAVEVEHFINHRGNINSKINERFGSLAASLHIYQNANKKGMNEAEFWSAVECTQVLLSLTDRDLKKIGHISGVSSQTVPEEINKHKLNDLAIILLKVNCQEERSVT